jgi:hypothetical protein
MLLVRATCWVVLVCDWIVLPVHAELIWTQKAVELYPDGKTTLLDAHFTFTNEGLTPVDIRQVQTSCGCTTATLKERHYEPGQNGEIVARYVVGDRVGIQRLSILVATSDNLVPTTLNLVVHVPELVHLRPTSVTWQLNESNTAKIITIETTDSKALPLKDVTVASSYGTVTTSVKPVLLDAKYEISVTPKTTSNQLFANLTIHCNLGGQPKTLHTYASVKPTQVTPQVQPPPRLPPAIKGLIAPPTPSPSPTTAAPH